ncbi:hypothetical protein LTR08_003197 [Meristemomyces frigidus]|nr:hypothetical protein LTR08_003197 [Meristemomyces frigidus]
MEALQVRHRKEQRDLQSRITQKKKQASKKTRKGVNDECNKLEDELKEKHASEVAAVSGEAPKHDDGVPSEQLEDLALKTDGDEKAHTTNGTDDIEDSRAMHLASDEAIVPSQLRKPNRQKARLAKRAADVEAQVRQAAEEAKNMPDMKQQERTRMLDSMKERGLHEKEIRADGHCLYSAVADQLEQLQIPLGSAPDEKSVLKYKAVRGAAANYIEQHGDDFVPFLEEPLPDYLHKIRDTGEWGGQLELMALAKSYGTDINVLQDFGRVEKIESGRGGEGRVMWLGYYKHGFGLGEHYNSLRKAA